MSAYTPAKMPESPLNDKNREERSIMFFISVMSSRYFFGSIFKVL